MRFAWVRDDSVSVSPSSLPLNHSMLRKCMWEYVYVHESRCVMAISHIIHLNPLFLSPAVKSCLVGLDSERRLLGAWETFGVLVNCMCIPFPLLAYSARVDLLLRGDY